MPVIGISNAVLDTTFAWVGGSDSWKCTRVLAVAAKGLSSCSYHYFVKKKKRKGGGVGSIIILRISVIV